MPNTLSTTGGRRVLPAIRHPAVLYTFAFALVMGGLVVTALVLHALEPTRKLEQIVEVLFVAAAPTLTALASLLKGQQTQKDVKALHVLVNSRMDELLRLTAAAAHDAGREAAAREAQCPPPEAPSA